MDQEKGFPAGTRYFPVPTPLLSSLLEEIGALEELKCTLRVLALVHQHKSKRLWVSSQELLADPVLVNGLSHDPSGASVAIVRGLHLAAERGTLLQAKGAQGEALFFVNDSPGRRARAALSAAAPPAASEAPSEPHGEEGEGVAGRPNIFLLYEENIGPVAPILAQEMEEAERTYPPSWIADAFQEAAARNRRNWRYIQRILERWASQGRDQGSEGTEHGESGRHPEETDRKEYLRRYGHLAGWDDLGGQRS
ncbi:MAG: DnaD domain protein [Chloroflexi bacterium]|nr:DnaD domain protein [Chloroflexota bacterium]